jgi:hypothetical protein
MTDRTRVTDPRVPAPTEGPDRAAYSAWPSRGDVAQVVGIVGGPLALLTALTAKYAIVQLWGCKSPATAVAVHLVALASVLLAAAAGVAAWRQWRPAGHGADPGDEGGPAGRTRTLATIGVSVSALSALVIVSQWLPQIFLDGCHQ